MNAQDTANHILVDLDTERQRNLLRNSWTSPVGIALFHLDNSIDKLSSRPLWTGFILVTGRKKEAVFPTLQCLVEAQKSGRF